MSENTDKSNDTINDIKEVIKERIHNPILATFVISWFAFNWDVILFALLSTKDIEDRIGILRSDYISFCKSFLGPFGAAIVVVLLIPIINFGIKKAVKYFTLKNTNHDTELRTEILKGRSNEAIAERDYIMKREGVDTINDLTSRTTDAENESDKIKTAALQIVVALKKIQETNSGSDKRVPRVYFDEEVSRVEGIVGELLSGEEFKTVSNLVANVTQQLYLTDDLYQGLLKEISQISDIESLLDAIDNSSPQNT